LRILILRKLEFMPFRPESQCSQLWLKLRTEVGRRGKGIEVEDNRDWNWDSGGNCSRNSLNRGGLAIQGSLVRFPVGKLIKRVGWSAIGQQTNWRSIAKADQNPAKCQRQPM
jgi:hypothetical protein